MASLLQLSPARATVARLTLLALLLGLFPAAVASPPLAAVEGRLVDVNGRAAANHDVHLIDATGASRARATTDTDGHYILRDVRPGSYALGIEAPDGSRVLVAGPPLRLGARHTLRHDLKLVETSPDAIREVGEAQYGFGSWWRGLPGGIKAAVVIGIAAAAVIAVSALGSDGGESPASPTTP